MKEKRAHQEPHFQLLLHEAGTRRDLDEGEKCDATQGGAEVGVWDAWSNGELTDGGSRD